MDGSFGEDTAAMSAAAVASKSALRMRAVSGEPGEVVLVWLCRVTRCSSTLLTYGLGSRSATRMFGAAAPAAQREEKMPASIQAAICRACGFV